MTRPFLWFENEAEEAAKFYTAIFKNSRIKTISRYGDEGVGPEGKVMLVVFELDGEEFMAINMYRPVEKLANGVGGPSFYITCETQAEIDHFRERLLADGGETNVCGWLTDKFGIAWNVVPASLDAVMRQAESEAARRAFKAVLQMEKLDIRAIEEAVNATVT